MVWRRNCCDQGFKEALGNRGSRALGFAGVLAFRVRRSRLGFRVEVLKFTEFLPSCTAEANPHRKDDDES